MMPGGRYPSRQGLWIDALKAEWVAAATYNDNAAE